MFANFYSSKKTLTLYFILNVLPSMFIIFLDEHYMEGGINNSH